jgi:hypothetical protein
MMKLQDRLDVIHLIKENLRKEENFDIHQSCSWAKYAIKFVNYIPVAIGQQPHHPQGLQKPLRVVVGIALEHPGLGREECRDFSAERCHL